MSSEQEERAIRFMVAHRLMLEQQKQKPCRLPIVERSLQQQCYVQNSTSCFSRILHGPYYLIDFHYKYSRHCTKLGVVLHYIASPYHLSKIREHIHILNSYFSFLRSYNQLLGKTSMFHNPKHHFLTTSRKVLSH